MPLPSPQKHEFLVQSASRGSGNLLCPSGTKRGTSIQQPMTPSGQAAPPGDAEPWLVWKSRRGEFFPESSPFAQEKGVCVRREVGNLEARPADHGVLHSSGYSPWALCKMMDISASLFFVFFLTLEEFKSLEERA